MHKIAAFMVVKDDAYYIDMALKSVLPYVDGIYIQDQNSTDEPLDKILEASSDPDYADKVFVDVLDTGIDRRFAMEYDEPKYRSMAVTKTEELFDPEWILKLDADEIYTPWFFETLNSLPLTAFNGVRVSGDRFISPTYRSVHPTSVEMSPEGKIFIDPHTQLWRAGRGHNYVPNPGFTRFHPILMPNPEPLLWLPGICNVHLHRTFGPKALDFWAEGGETKMVGPPYHPPTMAPDWYYSSANMGNAEEVSFEWPPYVMERWKEWGLWI